MIKMKKSLSIVFIFIALIVLLLVIFSKYLIPGKRATISTQTSTTITSASPTPLPTQSIASIAAEIIESQKVITHHYLELDLPPDQKEAVFYDLMSPLGALDPFAANLQSVPVKKIVNFLFGYYGKKFGIAEKRVLNIAQSTITFGLNVYDPVTEFTQNKSHFESISKKMQADSQIQLIGSWAIAVFRVNNYFGDINRNLVWEIKSSNGSFYNYSTIQTTKVQTLESQKASQLLNRYKSLYDETANLSIHTAYFCNGRTIIIMGGTSNNAFGYIHNATNKDDVNCGLLQNRFRIVKYLPLDSNWHYWVGI
jgi:hypothetical protein